MSVLWKWPGSRWWKCDFHIHTSESPCYRDPNGYTPSAWLAEAEKKGIQVLAVTDHNTANAIQSIQQENVSRGGSLVVFPGVELTVLDGIHVLALFDPGKSAGDICAFMGRCKIPTEKWGKPDCIAPVHLLEAVQNIRASGAVCMLAHVTGPGGVLTKATPGVGRGPVKIAFPP